MDIRYLTKIVNDKLTLNLHDMHQTGDYDGHILWRQYVRTLERHPNILITLKPLLKTLIEKNIKIQIFADTTRWTDSLVVDRVIELTEDTPTVPTKTITIILHKARYAFKEETIEARYQRLIKKVKRVHKKAICTEIIDLSALAKETLFPSASPMVLFNPKAQNLMVFMDQVQDNFEPKVDHDSYVEILEPFKVFLVPLILQLTKILYLTQFIFVPQIKECNPDEEAFINNTFQALCQKDIKLLTQTLDSATKLFIATEEYESPLKALSKNLNQAKIHRLKENLADKENRYNRLCQDLDLIVRDVTDLKKALGNAVFTDIDYENLMPIINKNPNLLILIDISNKEDNTTCQLYAQFKGELKVDPDLVKPHIIQDSNALLFFTELIRGNIQVPIVQPIKIKLGDNKASFTNSDNLFPKIAEVGITNPHISGYTCFGSYTHQIQMALESNNWAMVIELLAKSVQELNLADSAVLRSFTNQYLHADASIALPIIDTKTGALTKWKDYKKEYNDPL
jgi:hypothetical protein